MAADGETREAADCGVGTGQGDSSGGYDEGIEPFDCFIDLPFSIISLKCRHQQRYYKFIPFSRADGKLLTFRDSLKVLLRIKNQFQVIK